MEDGLLIYYKKLFEKKELKILDLSLDANYEYVFFDPITGKEYAPQILEANENGEWEVPNAPIMKDMVIWIRLVVE